MSSALFRYRLAVIVGAFGAAASIAIALGRVEPKPSALASLGELLGVPLAFLATGIACLVAFAFRAAGEARLGSIVYGQGAGARVVTSGPFRFTRNPLYIGTWLFFVAATAPYLPPLIVAVLALAFGLALRAITIHEERELGEAFGDAYARYRDAVPRFIGILRGAVDADDARPRAADWALATLSNAFFASLGLYRIAYFAFGDAKAGPMPLLGVINVAVLVVWLLVVVVRRLRAKSR